MDERLNPEELRELLGAFALGAVEPEDRTQVEEFVLQDRDARIELHQLEHAVAWLGHASPRPSDASWNAVRLEMARDLAESGTTDVAAGEEPIVPTDVISMDDFAERQDQKNRRKNWRQLVAVAAATVVLLGTAIGVAQVIREDSANPPGRTVALRAPDGGVPVEVVLHRNGTGSVRSSDLPRALRGQVYQLWAQASPTAPMHSAGLLGRVPEGRRLTVPRGTLRIAISVEPEGGSREPTTDPVAVSDEL